MSKVDQLLLKVIPQLAKDDRKAQKLRSKLVKLAGALWKRGPRRLEKLGVEVGREDYRPLDASDPDEFLENVLAALGSKEFVRFMAATKKELARMLAEKKAESAPRPPAPEKKRKPDKKPSSDLTMSDEGVVEGDGELALPSISDEGLAIPDELEVPSLAVPDDDAGGVQELDLDNLQLEVVGDAGAKPLGIRFGDDGGERDEDDSDPALAGDRALGRYRRSGESSELAQAKELYKRALKEAKNPVARGAARGGLAHVYLLADQLDKAKDMAKKAIKEFPAEPTANGVLCRVSWPQEAERVKLQALIYRAENAVRGGDLKEAKAVAAKLKKSYAKEPFAALILLAVAAESREDLVEPLQSAWKHYPPSEPFADLLLGPGLAHPIARSLLEWLREEIKEKGGDVRAQTVKDVESKDNVVAASIQIPHGVLRAELAGRENLDNDTEQQLRLWIAHTIFHAQHYDYAKEVYVSCRRFNRESGLLPEINKAETQCGVMKRSFDKPGVKSKMGKFDGVGAAQYRKAVAGRLKLVLEGLEGDRRKVDAAEAKLIDAILADEGRKQKLKKRAEKAGQDDPFARLESLDGEAGAPEEEAPKKGGLFGRMKAAATKAMDKAKGAVNASKRKEALKALGQRLRDTPEGGWKDPELDGFLAKVEKLEPRLEFLEEEAEKFRHAAGRAGDLTKD